MNEAIKSKENYESDWVSAMATVSELHNNFSHFDWTGFYRVHENRALPRDHIACS